MGVWNKGAMNPIETHEFYRNSVWASQILPGCMLVKGASIADLALKAYGKVLPYLLQNRMDPLLQLGERMKPAGAEGRPKKEGFLDFLGLPKAPKEDEEEQQQEQEQKEGEETPLTEEEIKQREKAAKRKRIEEERKLEDAERKRQEEERKAQEEAVRAIERDKKYGTIQSVAEERRAMRLDILREVNKQAAEVDFEQLGEWSLHSAGIICHSHLLFLFSFFFSLYLSLPLYSLFSILSFFFSFFPFRL